MMYRRYILTTLTLGLIMGSSSPASAPFAVEPVSVVQAEGLDAKFQCLYDSTSQVQYAWLIINGMLAHSIGNHTQFESLPPVGSPSVLTIIALPQYNGRVQCEATLRDGNARSFEFSMNATLLVQGPLESVTNLCFNETLSSPTAITISWSAPFSLNVTTIDPPYIQYCVDVYNVTGGGSHHLDSVCGITDTQYTYTAPDPTGVYNFTVTPRSNIQGSLNGTTSQPVRGHTIQIPIEIPAGYIKAIVRAFNSIEVTIQFPYSVLQGIFPGSMPTSYELILEFLDGTLNSPCRCQTTNSVENGMVVLKNIHCGEHSISKHEIFNLYLVTVNSVGSSMSGPQKTSTHHTSFQAPGPMYYMQTGQLLVNCSYLDGSEDLGYFIIVISELGFHYGVVYRQGLEESTAVKINGTGSDVKGVVAYDLHNSRSPERKSTSITPQPVTFMNGNTPSVANNILDFSGSKDDTSQANITIDAGRICLACHSHDCLGVIHPVNMSNLNLTLLKFNTTDLKHVCTDNTLQGNYSIAVFISSRLKLDTSPIYQEVVNVEKHIEEPSSPNDPGNSAIFAVTVVPIVILVAIIVVVVAIAVLRRRKKYMFRPPAKRTEMVHQMESMRYSPRQLKLNGNVEYSTSELPSTPSLGEPSGDSGVVDDLISLSENSVNNIATQSDTHTPDTSKTTLQNQLSQSFEASPSTKSQTTIFPIRLSIAPRPMENERSLGANSFSQSYEDSPNLYYTSERLARVPSNTACMYYRHPADLPF